MEVSIPAGAEPVVPQPERTPAAVRAAVARLDPAALADWAATMAAACDEYSVLPVRHLVEHWWVWVAVSRWPALAGRLRECEQVVAGPVTARPAARGQLRSARSWRRQPGPREWTGRGSTSLVPPVSSAAWPPGSGLRSRRWPSGSPAPSPSVIGRAFSPRTPVSGLKSYEEGLVTVWYQEDHRDEAVVICRVQHHLWPDAVPGGG